MLVYSRSRYKVKSEIFLALYMPQKFINNAFPELFFDSY